MGSKQQFEEFLPKKKNKTNKNHTVTNADWWFDRTCSQKETDDMEKKNAFVCKNIQNAFYFNSRFCFSGH